MIIPWSWCKNTVMLCTGLNNVIPNNPNQIMPKNPHDIVKRFKWEDINEQKDFMMSDCLSCSVANLSLSNFGGYNCERSDKDVSIEGLNTDMKSYEWRRDDDSHTKKTLVGVSNNEALVLLNQQIKISKKHIYVKRCQVKHYNELKQNLKSNEIILHVYFSGNYTNHQHQKVQSAYFDHSSFAVFTGCCCLISTDGSLIKESIVVVTESSDHSRITLSDYCISKAVHTLCKIQCTFQCTVNSRK